MNLWDKALPRFEELFRQVREVTRELGFSDKNKQHIIAVLLHGSIIEIADGILDTLKRSNGTAAWILTRSLLETFVDLINIADDSGYADFMNASFLEQQKKRIGIAQNRGATNPYLKSIADNARTLQHGQWVGSELERLKEKGVMPLNVKERFERAGQLDLYDGPYSIMSLHTHNNLGALEQQHLRMQPTGLTVTYFRELSDEDVRMLLDTAGGVLAHSLGVVKSLLEGDSPKGLEGIMEELGGLRDLWEQNA